MFTLSHVYKRRLLPSVMCFCPSHTFITQYSWPNAYTYIVTFGGRIGPILVGEFSSRMLTGNEGLFRLLLSYIFTKFLCKQVHVVLFCYVVVVFVNVYLHVCNSILTRGNGFSVQALYTKLYLRSEQDTYKKVHTYILSTPITMR